MNSSDEYRWPEVILALLASANPHLPTQVTPPRRMGVAAIHMAEIERHRRGKGMAVAMGFLDEIRTTRFQELWDEIVVIERLLFPPPPMPVRRNWYRDYTDRWNLAEAWAIRFPREWR